MNINPNAPLPKDKLSQLIDQNLADIVDAVNEGTPTDIRDLIKAQTEIAYQTGQKAENKAWLKGRRCRNCGKEFENTGLTDTCHKCWEMN
jgi:predicted Zn-ribbon and HTH transcriptional regulator